MYSVWRTYTGIHRSSSKSYDRPLNVCVTLVSCRIYENLASSRCMRYEMVFVLRAVMVCVFTHRFKNTLWICFLCTLNKLAHAHTHTQPPHTQRAESELTLFKCFNQCEAIPCLKCIYVHVCVCLSVHASVCLHGLNATATAVARACMCAHVKRSWKTLFHAKVHIRYCSYANKVR